MIIIVSFQLLIVKESKWNPTTTKKKAKTHLYRLCFWRSVLKEKEKEKQGNMLCSLYFILHYLGIWIIHLHNLYVIVTPYIQTFHIFLSDRTKFMRKFYQQEQEQEHLVLVLVCLSFLKDFEGKIIYFPIDGNTLPLLNVPFAHVACPALIGRLICNHGASSRSSQS